MCSIPLVYTNVGTAHTRFSIKILFYFTRGLCVLLQTLCVAYIQAAPHCVGELLLTISAPEDTETPRNAAHATALMELAPSRLCPLSLPSLLRLPFSLSPPRLSPPHSPSSQSSGSGVPWTAVSYA